MSKNEKACSDMAPSRQARTEQDRTFLQNNHITNEADFPVLNLLSEGKDSAIRPKVLTNVLGLKSTRELRKEIELERKNGALVLADLVNGGYYKPATLGEIKEFVAAMRHSIQTTEESIGPMEKVLETYGGPEIYGNG